MSTYWRQSRGEYEKCILRQTSQQEQNAKPNTDATSLTIAVGFVTNHPTLLSTSHQTPKEVAVAFVSA
ncbi:hypothetical protein HJC23_001521 [Cyclotella cryptica]|uniref:Uncharacterized protein n=1 Tax=Cyclotella cryptica TaxID=29204 RepID=A0ABD3P734_9STRA